MRNASFADSILLVPAKRPSIDPLSSMTTTTLSRSTSSAAASRCHAGTRSNPATSTHAIGCVIMVRLLSLFWLAGSEVVVLGRTERLGFDAHDAKLDN